jgi:hypothetical protein
MFRRLWILFALLSVVSGCSGPSAKEKYDAAMRELDRAQERLDRLRPAYDAAKLTAANALCREIAGSTPEEANGAAADAALKGLGDVLNQAATPPEEAKEGESGKKVAAGRKGDELDKLVESAAATQKTLAEQQANLAALAAPATKAKEVMAKINTPGTPEAKRLEEKLASYEEVNAYERQKKRVEQAQQDVDDAEKELPDGDKPTAKK